MELASSSLHFCGFCNWCLWCVRDIPGNILGCLCKCFPHLTADLLAYVICPAGTWHSWDLKPGLWLYHTSGLYGQFSNSPRATLWRSCQHPEPRAPQPCRWDGSQEKNSSGVINIRNCSGACCFHIQQASRSGQENKNLHALGIKSEQWI